MRLSIFPTPCIILKCNLPTSIFINPNHFALALSFAIDEIANIKITILINLHAHPISLV